MLTSRPQRNTDYYSKAQDHRSFGVKVADRVATVIGSWYFIFIQTTIIIIWVIANSYGIRGISKWDPYPFIFLNLALSFQAAYTAPIIMMSQNRQSQVDRAQAEADYQINRIAEKEIEVLQEELTHIKTLLQNHLELSNEVNKTMEYLKKQNSK